MSAATYSLVNSADVRDGITFRHSPSCGECRQFWREPTSHSIPGRFASSFKSTARASRFPDTNFTNNSQVHAYTDSLPKCYVSSVTVSELRRRPINPAKSLVACGTESLRRAKLRYPDSSVKAAFHRPLDKAATRQELCLEKASHVCSGARAADTVVKGPNGLIINRADFHKTPDGRWQSGPNGTLSYPDRPGSFANSTFGERGFNIGGVDIAVFLNQHCPQ
jgi:hypothetical protein